MDENASELVESLLDVSEYCMIDVVTVTGSVKDEELLDVELEETVLVLVSVIVN